MHDDTHVLGQRASSSDLTSRESQRGVRFGLNELFWTTGAIALTIAYLRQFDSPAVFVQLVIVAAVACLIGAIVGWWPQRMAAAIYWAVLIAVAGYLAVIVEPRADPLLRFAWPTVGAVTGALCANLSPNHLFKRMLVGAVSAAAIMLGFVLSGSMREGTFDLMCAPIVGALVGLLNELIFWIESRSRLARFLTASWLLLAVIVGNYFVPIVLN